MNNYYEAFAGNDDIKVSVPGNYHGFAKPEYNGTKYFSQYITMRDGVKIAVSYFRPTKDGELHTEPLPVIWRYTPYGRVIRKNGKLSNTMFFTGDGGGTHPDIPLPDQYASGCGIDGVLTGADIMVKVFTERGYVIAQADVRGKFASFGHRRSANSELEAQDGYEINEWFAAQPWCSGKTGMFGSSYTGQTQLEVLRKNPPALKAAMVCMTDINKFDGWAFGGIARGGDSDMNVQATLENAYPVEEDTDSSMLKAALEQHKLNCQDIPIDEGYPKVLPYYNFARLPYRDSFSETTGTRFWEDDSASSHLDEINNGGAAVYLIGGWYDVFRRDTVLLFNNITRPKKMIVGPWYHTRYKKELNLLVEHMRFYDYWLKGIDNGIMDEPPIYYKTINSEIGSGESWEDGWSFASQWPAPVETSNISLFLGKAGDENSLSICPPAENEAFDSYISDYTVSDWEEQDYADDIVSKGLVYSGEVLGEDVEITGHPMVEFSYTSSGNDGDFFVFLLDGNEEGKSHIVSIGRLRSSFRATGKAPYNFIGLPYHPCRKQDVQIPSFKYGPVSLKIDMKPTSYVFKKGHKIQLAITTSMSRFQFYRESPAPVLKIYRNSLYPARLILPKAVESKSFS